MGQNVKLAVVIGLITGVIVVWFAPFTWMPGIVLVPFALCIPLAWFVAFHSGAVEFKTFRWFGWPFKPSAPLVPSRALLALFVLAAFATGACLGIFLKNANA